MEQTSNIISTGFVAKKTQRSSQNEVKNLRIKFRFVEFRDVLLLFHPSFHVGVADKPKQNVVLVIQLMMCKILQTFCEIREFYVCQRIYTIKWRAKLERISYEIGEKEQFSHDENGCSHEIFVGGVKKIARTFEEHSESN